MTKILFNVNQFIATAHSTAEDKAKFANHFVRFVSSGFKQTIFPQWFYNRLSMSFGHIAHYNRAGFYDNWFRDSERQFHFLRNTANWGCYGDPHFTYCDVEKVLAKWVMDTGLEKKYADIIGKIPVSRAEQNFRCNKCHRTMKGSTAYDGACECGGLIENRP